MKLQETSKTSWGFSSDICAVFTLLAIFVSDKFSSSVEKNPSMNQDNIFLMFPSCDHLSTSFSAEINSWAFTSVETHYWAFSAILGLYLLDHIYRDSDKTRSIYVKLESWISTIQVVIHSCHENTCTETKHLYRWRRYENILISMLSFLLRASWKRRIGYVNSNLTTKLKFDTTGGFTKDWIREIANWR